MGATEDAGSGRAARPGDSATLAPSPPRPALIAAATATAAFVFALIAYAAWPEGASRPVEWDDLSSDVGPLTIRGETKRVFRDGATYATFLGDAAIQAVDFPEQQVLLVAPGPRSSSGYSVQVVRVTERDDAITVTVRERAPRLGEHVRPGVTFPYRLLALPSSRRVYVEWLGR